MNCTSSEPPQITTQTIAKTVEVPVTNTSKTEHSLFDTTYQTDQNKTNTSANVPSFVKAPASNEVHYVETSHPVTTQDNKISSTIYTTPVHNKTDQSTYSYSNQNYNYSQPSYIDQKPTYTYIPQTNVTQSSPYTTHSQTNVVQYSTPSTPVYSQPKTVTQTYVSSQPTDYVLPAEYQQIYNPPVTVRSSTQNQPVTYVTTAPQYYQTQPVIYDSGRKQSYSNLPVTTHTNYVTSEPVQTVNYTTTHPYVSSQPNIVTYNQPIITQTPSVQWITKDQVTNVPSNVSYSERVVASNTLRPDVALSGYYQPTTIYSETHQPLPTSRVETQYITHDNGRVESRKSVSFINHDESHKDRVVSSHPVQSITQVYNAPVQTSTTRTYTNVPASTFKDVISWEEFQQLKRQDPNINLKEDLIAHQITSQNYTTAPIQTSQTYTYSEPTTTYHKETRVEDKQTSQNQSDHKNLEYYLQTNNKNIESLTTQIRAQDQSNEKYVYSNPTNELTEETHYVTYTQPHTNQYQQNEEHPYENYQNEQHAYQDSSNYQNQQAQETHKDTQWSNAENKQQGTTQTWSNNYTQNIVQSSPRAWKTPEVSVPKEKIRRYKIVDGKQVEISDTTSPFIPQSY